MFGISERMEKESGAWFCTGLIIGLEEAAIPSQILFIFPEYPKKKSSSLRNILLFFFFFVADRASRRIWGFGFPGGPAKKR